MKRRAELLGTRRIVISLRVKDELGAPLNLVTAIPTSTVASPLAIGITISICLPVRIRRTGPSLTVTVSTGSSSSSSFCFFF